MFRRLAKALCLVALLAVAQQVSAAENPLDAVSNDAGVVFRLKAWSATVDKLKAFAGAVGQGAAQQIEPHVGRIGQMISNPTLAGVDQAADWWVAVYPRPAGQEPQFVFVIPASDMSKMKQGLPSGMKFLEFGKYGVYTEDADAAEKTAARIKGEGKSIATVIEKESSELFDRGDLSVFLNIKRLATVYRDQIEELKQQAEQGIQLLAMGIPGGAGMNLGEPGGALDGLLQVFSQGLDDMLGCTVAANVTNEGLAFEDLMRFVPDSATDKLLQKSPPAALSVVEALPAGAMGYFGMQADFSTLLDLGKQAAAGLEQASDEAKKEIAAAFDALKNLKRGAAATSLSLGDPDTGVLRTVSISEVEEPAQARALTNRMVKAAGAVDSGMGLKQVSKISEDAEKLGDVSVDHVKVTLEAGDQIDPQGVQMMQGYTEAIYGPEGMLTRHVYLKDKVVQSSGGGKDAMQAALAALADKNLAAGGSATFTQIRGKLLDKANLLALFDLPGTVRKALQLAGESGQVPIPIDVDALAAMKLAPSYLGIAVGTEPQGLRIKTYFPSQQVTGVLGFVQMYAEMMGPGVAE